MTTSMTRRDSLKLAAAGVAATTFATESTFAKSKVAPKLAVSTASYMIRGRLKRQRGLPPDVPVFRDAVHFVEHCHQLGAGGVQVGVGAWHLDGTAKKVRARAEEFGMVIEGQIGLPRNEDSVDEFERSVKAGKEAGVLIFRTVMLGGRRYETFKTKASWEEFRKDSWKRLTLAEPIMRRHGVKLALENHKDWRVDEMRAILERISSEHVGVNLDMGNNISLLEDPMEVIVMLAPFTMTTHIKDMGVREYEDGFLLSEVPFGDGFVDIPRAVEICRKANPNVQFNLEMITRDPLKVPCLTDAYWETFDRLPAKVLARALAMVKKNPSKKDLPTIAGMSLAEQVAFEEENNRKSFEWWKRVIG